MRLYECIFRIRLYGYFMSTLAIIEAIIKSAEAEQALRPVDNISALVFLHAEVKRLKQRIAALERHMSEDE